MASVKEEHGLIILCGVDIEQRLILTIDQASTMLRVLNGVLDSRFEKEIFAAIFRARQAHASKHLKYD